jgi:transglutaminase-like putative cysteine protease
VTEPRRRTDFLRTAEVALTVVTLATIASMWRLFVDGSFFVPLALHAIAAHVLVAALRRRGVAATTSALVCLIVAVLALTWGHLLSSTAFGLPTGATATEAGDQLELAWRTFGDVRAPAPVLDGFLLSAGAAIWVGAWLSDLAAFRLWTPFEALIPSGTLFLFASLFSADQARPLAAALWLAAALTFVLLHRCARQQSSPSWLGSDARAGTWALVRVGGTVAAVAVLVGSIVGPNLPGAEAEPVVAIGSSGGGGSRTTVSPLVEIRRRLIDQSQTELFTVDVAPVDRQYWRLTALDIFDGEIWSSRGSFGGSGGDLGDGSDADLPTHAVVQRFEISSLAAIWLPAAYEAAGVQAHGTDVRWDDVTSTLIVGRDLPTSDQISYEVTSAVVDHDPTELAGATGTVPDEVQDRDLALPSDFPETVRADAQHIVGGATSPYEQARALQDSFLDGSFTYSLDAPAGHSDSAIEDFLFVTRTGYCEQFAGTFAAMSRSIGLPARVAVGFTPGEPDPITPGRFVVRGEHAHAWPEVYLAGIGWVAFEPTPGRGAPHAEDVTGRPEAQDTAGPSTQPTLTPESSADPATDPTTPDTLPTPTTALLDAGQEGISGEPAPSGPSTLARAATALGVGLVIALFATVVLGCAVAALRAVRRRVERARATTPEAQASVAIDDTAEALALGGLFAQDWETRLEFGNRVAVALHLPEAARLGQLLTRADFDPAGISPEDAVEVLALAATIRTTMRARTPWWRRILAAADPRSTRQRARAARGRGGRPTGVRIRILPTLAEP